MFLIGAVGRNKLFSIFFCAVPAFLGAFVVVLQFTTKVNPLITVRIRTRLKKFNAYTTAVQAVIPVLGMVRQVPQNFQ